MTDRNTITLNLRHDIPEADWGKVLSVYRSMDGWIEGASLPSWYGTEHEAKHIVASVEPGGILFDASVDSGLWTAWLTVLCSRLTLALGREVHDAEF